MRIASLTLVCLALLALPAMAQQVVLYDNGPGNGTVDAWTINFGYVVSDNFVLTGSSTVQQFDFWTWVYPRTLELRAWIGQSPRPKTVATYMTPARPWSSRTCSFLTTRTAMRSTRTR